MMFAFSASFLDEGSNEKRILEERERLGGKKGEEKTMVYMCDLVLDVIGQLRRIRLDLA